MKTQFVPFLICVTAEHDLQRVTSYATNLSLQYTEEWYATLLACVFEHSE